MKPLAAVTRNNYVESVHYGYICVVDSQGNVLYHLGDYSKNIFFRSSAKPIQTIAVLKSGAADYYNFDSREIAIACSSHSGEGIHQQLVLDLIKRLDLQPSDLHCGVMQPYNEKEQLRLVKENLAPSVFHCSCSGKHAAMLALTKYRNKDIANYEELQHEVQQEILEVIAEFSNLNKDSISVGTDGCGVPIYLLPMNRIALSYAKLMEYSGDQNHPYNDACGRIVAAMMKHPQLVGGEGEFCTDLMKITGHKLIGKVGCEAVYCIGVKERNLGICIKIADGNERALYPIVIHLLNQLELLNIEELEALGQWYRPLLKNNLQEEIGRIVPIFNLNRPTVNHDIMGQSIDSIVQYCSGDK